MFKNKTTDSVISETVLIADSFFKRLKGLMFTKELSSQTALYIYPCSAIHTFFMNYNIDVLYLDNNNIVLDIDKNMKPRQIGKVVRNAVAVVELLGGRADQTNIQVGQKVEFIKGRECKKKSLKYL